MRKKYSLLIAILLFIIFIIVAYFDLTNKSYDYRDDYESQQMLIQTLIEENYALRVSNDALRRGVLDYGANISIMRTKLLNCEKWCPAVTNGTQEIADPAMRVPLNDILVDPNKVIINIPDIQIGMIANSNSMDPVLDENHVVLEIIPSSPDSIKPGDIMIFEHDGERIIHRVIDTGNDLMGWYAITKGDNIAKSDPGKVRFSDVRGVVVGVIY